MTTKAGKNGVINIFVLSVFLLCAGWVVAIEKGRTLIFLDNSVSNDTYIPSNKQSQIESAFELASHDLVIQFPKCKINFKKQIERADQLNIFKQAEKIKLEYSPQKTILIGIIHSSEAILASKAFNETNFQFLSSGATTENLNNLNSNFYTLANPVSRFVANINEFIKKKGFKSIVIVLPGNSSYAKEFADSLRNSLTEKKIVLEQIEYNPSNIENDLVSHHSILKKADLIFAPGFIQQSLAAVSYINKIDPYKSILGTPNWGRSISDLRNVYDKLQVKKSKIYFPVSWISGENSNSRVIEAKFVGKYNEEPMGTAIYTYDAAMIAGIYLCNNKKVMPIGFSNYLSKGNFNKHTARKYNKMQSGHLTSDISIVEFNGSARLSKEISE